MSDRYEKARAIAEAAANRWDQFSDTAGVQWLADQICENCAGQKHTDMGTTLCPVCAGSGINPPPIPLPAHRLFMGPLADWALSLKGGPVSTEKLAELVRICAALSCPTEREVRKTCGLNLTSYREIAAGTTGAFMAPADVAVLLGEIDRLNGDVEQHRSDAQGWHADYKEARRKKNEIEAENAQLREEWAQEGIGWLRDKDIDRLMGVEEENKRLQAENECLRIEGAIAQGVNAALEEYIKGRRIQGRGGDRTRDLPAGLEPACTPEGYAQHLPAPDGKVADRLPSTQGIEARSAETSGSAEGESPVAEGHAPDLKPKSQESEESAA